MRTPFRPELPVSAALGLLSLLLLEPVPDRVAQGNVVQAARLPFPRPTLQAGRLHHASRGPSRASSEPFAPVAPAPAIHSALRSNLKIVQDWLNDQDFASAAEAAEGLGVLAHVYQYQSAQAGWQQKTSQLLDACRKLTAQAKAKDSAGCDATARQCSTLLEELKQAPAGGDKVTDPAFKPGGSTRTLMKLLDGTYADAKSAKTTGELANLAFTLAEASNVTKHLRNDSAWREAAEATREAALQVAKTAPQKDLASARAELKDVYTRCEACHRGFKRKS